MSTKSIRQQFADTMLDVGQEDSSLVVMVGDITHFALQPFAEACPGRYYNIGICEPTMLSMAAGMKRSGLTPVVHTIAPFLIERGFEQIKLDFCYHKLGGNIVTVGSAFDYANLGCTHHCYGDFALLKTLQNIRIMYPSSSQEFDALFKETYQSSELNIFRVPGTPHGVTWNKENLESGKGIQVSSGSDLTLIATGPQLKSAVEARENLQCQGWDVEIIYIHTIRPLDTEMIYQSVSKTKRCIIIEEHMQTGGLASDVLQAVYTIPGLQFSSIGIPDTFIHPYGSYELHCKNLGLCAEGIVSRVNQSFSRERELVST